MPRRRVVVDGKAEADTRLLEAPRLRRAVGVDVDPEAAEHLGRAASRAGAVAVLGHGDPGRAARGGDDRGRRRDVERLGRSPRARGVHEPIGIDPGLHLVDVPAHDPRRSQDLGRGGRAGGEQREQGTDLPGLGVSGHDRLEGGGGLVGCECAAGDEHPHGRRQAARPGGAIELRRSAHLGSPAGRSVAHVCVTLTRAHGGPPG